MSNAYTLLIIYARIDLTPWYIEFLYCLLVVEELIYQFKMNIGNLNGDLLQLSGIRYEAWSFSVKHLISIAYWKGLIFGVKLSVVVPLDSYVRHTCFIQELIYPTLYFLCLALDFIGVWSVHVSLPRVYIDRESFIFFESLWIRVRLRPILVI